MAIKSMRVRRMLVVMFVSGLVAQMGLSPSTHASETPVETSAAGEAGAPPVVAHFHLAGALTEIPVEDPFGFMGGKTMSLKDLLNRLDQARQDDTVKAVVLTFDRMSFGFGQLEEIRGAIKRLRQVEKPVLVHAEGMCTGNYALLSAASDFCIAPQSHLWLTGLYGESLYVKGLLEKIGVEADFLQMGEYKSAAEMLTRTGPSEPAEANVNWLFDGLYDSLINMIAESRGLDPGQVRQLVDDGPYLAERAVKVGLIDSVQYRDAFMAGIRERFGEDVIVDNRYGEKTGPQINFANPFAVFGMLTELFGPAKAPEKDSVAIVYVEGMILPGHTQPNPFGPSGGAYSGDIRKALEKATQDDTVKAVVLRVDSPGGSGLASEIIWHAAMRVKATKPLIVSMGNVAGSGGYYVSCGADAIFADETTITASIGVVGGKLVTTGMWDKLGVNWIGYQRGANADIFSSAHRFDESQRTRMRQLMQDVYKTFLDRVVARRGEKLTRPIDQLAGGRVYTGKQARDLGLVDQIGGLTEAIEYAAAQASISDYEVRVIPRPKDMFTQWMEQMSGQGERSSDIATGWSGLAIGGEASRWEAGLPILRQLEPQRAQALMRAIERIELIRREGVTLMMAREFVLY